jgi:hypothetical protein
LFEAVRSGDVVDVGVGDDDLFDGELVLLKDGEDAGDVVAGVYDDGFAGGFVTEDGAVALEWAYDEDFVDHWSLRVPGNENAQAGGPAHGEAGGSVTSSEWSGCWCDRRGPSGRHWSGRAGW